MGRVIASLFSAVACAVTVGVAVPADAQSPTSQPLGGAAVPGVCLLSRQVLFAEARVGIAATARLQQLTEEARAEVAAATAPVDADVNAFQAEQAKLIPAQRQAREQALALRVQALRAKAQQRNREIEATRDKVMRQIANDAEPVLMQVYRARNCGLLIDRSVVLGGNMTNDLTPAVIQGLDARITTISFNREVLPAQAPAGK